MSDDELSDTARLRALLGDSIVPGQVRVDERGARFEWSNHELEADTVEAERLRLKALTNPNLALDDDDTDYQRYRNPYDSGPLRPRSQKPGPQQRKRLDLREFSKWVALRKKFHESSP